MLSKPWNPGLQLNMEVLDDRAVLGPCSNGLIAGIRGHQHRTCWPRLPKYNLAVAEGCCDVWKGSGIQGSILLGAVCSCLSETKTFHSNFHARVRFYVHDGLKFCSSVIAFCTQCMSTGTTSDTR